ncbi:class I SAM-dependent methyltransferase [Corynebacterium lehmanniae]|uniref:class I SAM-dependent methyltransferase n=1 Tax=Corynebacterium haemomassiliense TaxID=2754726 RepID=UPI00370D5AAA
MKRPASTKVIATALAACLLSAPTAIAKPSNTIHAKTQEEGDIESLEISPNLHCMLRHHGNIEPSFFGGDSCGTFIAIEREGGNGEIEYDAFGSGAYGVYGYEDFTPISQEVTGTGKPEDPFRIISKVAAGSTGIVITQEDRLLEDNTTVMTKIEVENNSGQKKNVALYRAGDCYLADNDLGEVAAGETYGACVNKLDKEERLIQFRHERREDDHKGGDRGAIAARYQDVYGAISRYETFRPLSGQIGEVDNGAGLSWKVSLPNGKSNFYSSMSYRRNTEASDKDKDHLLDSWEDEGAVVNSSNLRIDAWTGSDQPDVLVSVGWMAPPSNPTLIEKIKEERGWTRGGARCWGFEPDQEVLDRAAEIFAESGIRVHFDKGDANSKYSLTKSGGEIEYREFFSPSQKPKDLEQSFDWQRDQILSRDSERLGREKVFHTVLFADKIPGDHTGLSSDIPGRDAVIGYTLEECRGGTVARENREVKARVLVHELGHNLGLGHGGPVALTNRRTGIGAWREEDAHINCKPEYRSIMNYRYLYNIQAIRDKDADGVKNQPLFSDIYAENLSWPLRDKDADNPGECRLLDREFFNFKIIDDPYVRKYNVASDVDNFQFGGELDGEKEKYIGYLAGDSLLANASRGSHSNFVPEAPISKFFERGLVNLPGQAGFLLVGEDIFVQGLEGQTTKFKIENIGSTTLELDLLFDDHPVESFSLLGFEQKELDVTVPAQAVQSPRNRVNVSLVDKQGNVLQKSELEFDTVDPQQRIANEVLTLINDMGKESSRPQLVNNLRRSLSDQNTPATTTNTPATTTNTPATTTNTPATTTNTPATTTNTPGKQDHPDDSSASSKGSAGRL